jgi:cysteine desulfurase/selenocysteine lyase
MHPFFGGGDMITNVTMSGSEFKKVPHLLESGTQNVGGAVALAKAFQYMDSIGRENIEIYVNSLGTHAWNLLSEIPGLKLLGPKPGANRSSSLVSFTFEYDDAPHWIDNDALASALDSKDIYVRHGRFCAQPTVKWARLMPNGAVRASFHIYNTFEDVERLAAVVTRIEQTMQ